MSKKIKLTLLKLAELCGIFALCRYWYRHHLRVLCYHGFAYADEHQFRPKLFMTPQTFAARLQYLANSPYQIVSLSEGLAHPDRPLQLALTMDDGWSGTSELVGDALAKHKFPLMLYVTSYYADKQIPVLNVAVSYLLWKTSASALHLQVPGVADSIDVSLPSPNTAVLVKQICQLIDQLPEAAARAEVLYQLADQLQVSLHQQGRPLFRLLDADELRGLQQANVELQLHTHRHCSPLDAEALATEISQNRQWLAQFIPKEQLVHFCYPSGEYQQAHLPLLQQNGVLTATTTHIGLHKQGSDVLQIRRILDGEDVHWLELEAELSGFSNLVRQVLGVAN
ncbi:polysaccharide deacetylase family protein [Rheinheimera texasensis]|uniref:polysaccharide deacetylase family protein n=1 Tax=Rheinheimera texasensis TaxID=306205 RepID=UPI0004E0EECF|nr:polysaccharide deacetylase family protein [Rheinheimera texasensis]